MERGAQEKVAVAARGFAEIGGAKLYFEEAGEGPAVLLLHAGVADCRMWDDQLPALAAHHRTIRFDTRGFGRTSMPPGEFSYHGDVAGLLDFLRVPGTSLVGCSFGGEIAIDFALTHPTRVASLVLVGAGIGGREPSAEVSSFGEAEEAALERGDLEAATELNLWMWVDGPSRSPDQVAAQVRERVREMQMGIFELPMPVGVIRRRLEPPAASRLSDIRVPTMVLVGELDVADVKAVSERLAAEIPGAKRVSIPAAAHMVNMERPAEFNRLVLEFLAAGTLRGLEGGPGR